jgi:Holliday junction resolvase RusA-like endonuclease
MKISIYIPEVPPRATAQSKGVFVDRKGRPRFFKKAPQKAAEENTLMLLKRYKPEGHQPMTGPLNVSIRLIFPYRKSEKKSVVRSGELVPMGVRPDIDNLIKSMLDAAEPAGLWKDDGQVARLLCEKFWGPIPHWTIDVESFSAECLFSGHQQDLELSSDDPGWD